MIILGLISIFQNIIPLGNLSQFLNLFLVIQPSNRQEKKKKKKNQISPNFVETYFYKSTIYSWLTIFGIIFGAQSFIKVTTHQPHCEDVMAYLETLVAENPTWARNTGLENMKWKDFINVIKTIWRRYKNGKKWKDFDLGVDLS